MQNILKTLLPKRLKLQSPNLALDSLSGVLVHQLLLDQKVKESVRLGLGLGYRVAGVSYAFYRVTLL